MDDIIKLLSVEIAAAVDPDRQAVIEQALRASVEGHGIMILDSNESDNCCFHKAYLKGEPTFTLRAQDITAEKAILYWLQMNPQLSEERRREALQKVHLMEAWPTRRLPD